MPGTILQMRKVRLRETGVLAKVIQVPQDHLEPKYQTPCSSLPSHGCSASWSQAGKILWMDSFLCLFPSLFLETFN